MSLEAAFESLKTPYRLQSALCFVPVVKGANSQFPTPASRPAASCRAPPL